MYGGCMKIFQLNIFIISLSVTSLSAAVDKDDLKAVQDALRHNLEPVRMLWKHGIKLGEFKQAGLPVFTQSPDPTTYSAKIGTNSITLCFNWGVTIKISNKEGSPKVSIKNNPKGSEGEILGSSSKSFSDSSGNNKVVDFGSASSSDSDTPSVDYRDIALEDYERILTQKFTLRLCENGLVQLPEGKTGSYVTRRLKAEEDQERIIVVDVKHGEYYLCTFILILGLPKKIKWFILNPKEKKINA